MSSSKFYEPRLSDSICQAIAELYFLCDRDPKKISEKMDPPFKVTVADLQHPKVRTLIEAKVREGRKMLTREQHIKNLQEIRDKAMELEEPNFAIALKAEIAAGTAAGIYDRLPGAEEGSTQINPETMSTEEIRAKLQSQGKLPSPSKEQDGEYVDFEDVSE